MANKKLTQETQVSLRAWKKWYEPSLGFESPGPKVRLILAEGISEEK